MQYNQTKASRLCSLLEITKYINNLSFNPDYLINRRLIEQCTDHTDCMNQKLLIFISTLHILTLHLAADEVVVLLHGLARTSNSMQKLANTLQAEDYLVQNIDYPSRHMPIEALARNVRNQLEQFSESGNTIHFVTHSMGGIIVRAIQKESPLENIGRVVMLSPPNKGSELVDALGDYKLFEWINGPAGKQLGTDNKGFVANLGPVGFELGVIAGDRSINWINSIIIPSDDDGKVSTERAKVEGMREYKIIHATHPYIMKNDQAINAVLQFLKSGRFTQE